MSKIPSWRCSRPCSQDRHSCLSSRQSRDHPNPSPLCSADVHIRREWLLTRAKVLDAVDVDIDRSRDSVGSTSLEHRGRSRETLRAFLHPRTTHVRRGDLRSPCIGGTEAPIPQQAVGYHLKLYFLDGLSGAQTAPLHCGFDFSRTSRRSRETHRAFFQPRTTYVRRGDMSKIPLSAGRSPLLVGQTFLSVIAAKPRESLVEAVKPQEGLTCRTRWQTTPPPENL
jgi:hypothetical protein